MKELLADVCDDLAKHGYASENDIEISNEPVKTLVAARYYEAEEVDTKEYIVNLLEESFMIVVPMKLKEENGTSSNS